MIRKLRLLCLIAVVSSAPAAFVNVAWGQGAPPTECDRLAAEPDDVERAAPGVSDDALNPALAIPACERAVEQIADSRRLLFQLGRAYLIGANPNAAFIRFSQAAEQGHILAQTYVGALYLEGSGIAKDDTQASVWFRKAAEQGDSVAQFNLATLYETGRGVPKDETQAVVWYQKSADQGFSLAQASLGRMYAAGLGVARDQPQAAEWYRKAAEQGEESAQYRLAAMYADGQGVPKDEAQAIAWYRKAAEKSYLDAAGRLAALQAAAEATPPTPKAAEPTPPTPQVAAQAAPQAGPAEPAQSATPAAASESDQAKGRATFFRIILSVVGAAVVALAALLFVVTRNRAPRPVDHQLESLKAEAGTGEAVAAGAETTSETSPATEVSPFAAELEAIPAQPTAIEAEDAVETDDAIERSGDGSAAPEAHEDETSTPAPAPNGAAAHEPAQFTATEVTEPAPAPAPVIMKRCSQCQKEIPANDYFCCHCGALAIRFSDCQHDVREDARFCPRCGAILRWATQRPTTSVGVGAASAAQT